MLSRYLKILRDRKFSLLWLGQIVSQFGDRLTQIALVGLVSKASMSSSSLAFTMSMAIIPVFLISPISGIYIDRWSKRKTMYISDFMRGIFLLLIPFFFLKLNSLMPIYFLIFLSFSAGRFFIPSKMAFIPQVVKKPDIFIANSLISITATIAAILGFGLGGIIVEFFGITSAFILDAATFFISGIFIFLIPVREKGDFIPTDILDIGKEVVDNVKKSFLRELKEGVHYICNSHETKYAFKIFFFLFSYIGGLYVVFIRFIQGVLSSVTSDLGFVVVFLGGGIFFGSLLYGRIAHKFAIRKIINFAVLLASLYLIFFVLTLRAHPFSLYAFFHAFVLGILISPAFIGINALIHKESDESLLGRIFSGLELISHLGFLVSMFLASFLADIFNTFTIIVAIGIIGSIFSLFFILTDREHGSNRGTQAPPA
ncbi:MAG: MFS transporter [Candidatus Omnitrophica bacterium]|nr:MFS transporter [Candidatus Omnitrophota bacterium]MBD3268940.1 MFS transporter [Candidatus Omnitrophota bacterium]